jgi:hypothetical protein
LRPASTTAMTLLFLDKLYLFFKSMASIVFAVNFLVGAKVVRRDFGLAVPDARLT